MPHLKVSKLTCYRYPHRLFSEVSFTLEKGESLALIGANGMGKSSLLRILADLATPEQGQIDLSGTIAYLGHQQGLHKTLSPIENLTYTQILQGLRPSTEMSESVLAQVGLAKKMWHQVSEQLSQGQSRRLAFAQLLIKQATLWLLDEPYAALDESGRSCFEALIEQHLTSGGMCILTAHSPLSSCTKQLDLAAYAKT